jgi:predicted Rossmann-fold nucleotide-binding protein
VAGYYDGIADFLAHAVEERFLRVEHLEVLMVESDPKALIETLRDYQPTSAPPKWIDRGET